MVRNDWQLTVRKTENALNSKRETVKLILTKDFNMKVCGRILLNSEQKMGKASSEDSARLLTQPGLLEKIIKQWQNMGLCKQTSHPDLKKVKYKPRSFLYHINTNYKYIPQRANQAFH